MGKFADVQLLAAIDPTPGPSAGLVLTLCAVAGVATVFLLPGRPEATVRKIAGAVLTLAGLIFVATLVATPGFSAGFYFWVFASIAVVSAVRVVTHPRPVYSALYFVLTVFASAGLFVLLEAEFMAAALVIIYAGAILVTYVFVIMLATQATGQGGNGTDARQMAWYDAHSREPAAAAAVGFGLMGTLLFVIFQRAAGAIVPYGAPAAVSQAPVSGQTQQLGQFLFDTQSAQLELAGVILLVSMVGAIIITRKTVFVPTSSLPVAPPKVETVNSPNTPTDDNPHSLPVDGSPRRGRQVRREEAVASR